VTSHADSGAAGMTHLGDQRHLQVSGHTVIHRLPPETKIFGLFAFALVVAVTPRREVLVFAVAAIVAGVVIGVAGIPAATVLVRLSSVVPFVLFAVFIPFIADGEQIVVFGVSLSTDGLWSTFNIVAKALLCTGASIVVSATTPIPDVVRGLGRLRLPAVMVSIIAFMFRYLEVIADELHRMRRSMTARCHDPRWLWQARPIASSAGSLFVRSYERGERVHLAMLSRGFTGHMPALDERHASTRDWVMASLPAGLVSIGLLVALVIR
jgi:cobalt/nickel transport system permease protein